MRMTNEVAISVITTIKGIITNDNSWTDEAKIAVKDAFDLAIEALEEKTQGEWKRHDEWRNGEYIGGFYHVNCPAEDGYYSKWEYNYCPNCGIKMRKGDVECISYDELDGMPMISKKHKGGAE